MRERCVTAFLVLTNTMPCTDVEVLNWRRNSTSVRNFGKPDFVSSDVIIASALASIFGSFIGGNLINFKYKWWTSMFSPGACIVCEKGIIEVKQASTPVDDTNLLDHDVQWIAPRYTSCCSSVWGLWGKCFTCLTNKIQHIIHKNQKTKCEKQI